MLTWRACLQASIPNSKTFRQISDQCERIMRSYLAGYGTTKMIERVEDIFFRIPNLGKQY